MSEKKPTIADLANAIIRAVVPFTKHISENEVKTETTSVETQPTETPESDQVWALDSGKEFYIPWLAEIHASTKTTNADGTFRKLKGKTAPSKDEFIKIEGAHVDKFGLEAELYELEDGQPVAINVEDEPEETPTKPSKPSKPGKPSKPSKPGKPSKPSGPNNRKLALDAVNKLTKDFEVDYDFLIKELLVAEFGVEAFGELDSDSDEDVLREAQAWLDWLTAIKSVLTQCEEYDSEHGDDLVDGFYEVLSEFAESIGEISRADLNDADTAVRDYLKPWTDYYAG